MGDIDIRVKNFVKLRSIFAQLFSEGVFHGKVEIDPDKLQELDTVNQETVRLEDGQLKGMERLRDAQKITMLFDDKMAFQLIMGVEGQTGIHYYMPVRCMELDAMSYSAQCRNISEKAKRDKKLKKYSDGVPKGTKIIPVVTLVLYTGRKKWDAPLSVYDGVGKTDDSGLPHEPDRCKAYEGRRCGQIQWRSENFSAASKKACGQRKIEVTGCDVSGNMVCFKCSDE